MPQSGKRLQQPFTQPTIDYSNPLTNKIAAVVVATKEHHYNVKDIGPYKHKLLDVITSQPHWSVAPKTPSNILSFYRQYGNGSYKIPFGTSLTQQNITLAAVGGEVSTQVCPFISVSKDTARSVGLLGNTFDFIISVPSIRIGGAADNIDYYISDSKYAINNRSLNMVATFANSNTSRLYCNGEFLVEGNDSYATFDSTFNLEFGHYANGNYQISINGWTSLLVAWNRALSNQEAIEFSKNPWQIFKPLNRFLWVEVPNLLSPRYARPLLDVSNSGWSASSGSDLYAMIDEETPSDTDYIFATTSGSTYEAKLQPVTDPNTAINQIIKYRTRSLYNNTLIAKLKQGSTVIATRTHTNVPSEWTTYSMVLSESEANAITDYTDLRIHTEIA